MRQRITCNILRKILLCLFFLSSLSYGWAQTKVIADQVTYKSGNKPLSVSPTVQSPNNALGDNNNYATLLASPGTALSIGNYDGVIELQFATTRPANSWSYIQIGNGDQGLLDALLGGNLGQLLKDVVGVVLGGSQYFSVEAKKDNGSAIDSRNSNQGFNTDRFRLIQDADGNNYIAIRPSAEYNRLRITNSSIFSVLGAGAEFKLYVYNAFYYEDNNQDCGRPVFTSFDGTTGINLDVLPVEDGTLGNAIDGDLDTYSTLKSSALLGLSVAGSLSQNFYFATTTDESSSVNIKIALGTGSLLDLKVLSAVDIIFKNNGTAVATRSLSSGLLAGTDLLGLLKNGEPVTLSYGLGVAFDQVEIRTNALIGLGVGNADVKIYDVQRYDGVNCVNPNITITSTPPMLSNKACATTLIAHGHANFPTHSVDGDNDTFTTLEASSGIAVGIGAYDGFVELGFAQTIPAGETTYIRIDFDDEVLGGLLNGSVGGLLNGVVSNVLFGSHYFTIEGKNNGTMVYNRSSNDGFSSAGKTGSGLTRIIQDKNGHYYVAITPDVSIDAVRITEKLGALVGLGTVKSMNVYHACYSTGSTACEQGFATFSESSGITLDLLGLGAAGVTDAQNAIDGDIATASKISVGAVGVAGSMMQHIQFHGLSSDRDHFRVKMKMNTNGVVDADIIGSIIVKAYNGDQEVYSQRLNERLIPGVDLLNLLSTGQMINIPFAPGEEFDRVAVGIASLVAANVIAVPLEVYSVERFSADCPDPELTWDPKTDSPFNTPDCANALVSFENVNFPYEAITDNPNYDTYATLTAGAGAALGVGAYSSHIELKYGSTLAAHEVSYIRVDSEANLFNALLGGSLGNALGDLLGSVALGNQYIVVQAKDAAGNNVGTAHSSATSGFNTEFVKLVKDKDGKFYLAVTAPDAYQSVRIEYYHTALVGAMGSSSMNVYSMCRETEFDACEQAAFTSWDGDGIALDVAGLTNGGVANPEFAIDADNSNYSALNLGVASVAASVSQKVYFKTKSNIDDELRVRLQLANPGVLNLDVFGGSELIFYNGEQNVGVMPLSSGLINNIDLLALFNSGGVQSFTFAPGVVYDRVELKIASLVAVNTSEPIRLYGMSRLSSACPDPDFLSPNDVFKSPVCADDVEVGTIKAVDDVDFAIDGDYNSYATMRADAGAIFGINNQPSVLELKFGSSVNANTTSYLRVGDDAGILESLLSGSIGEVVYNLLNNVALGDNYFVVRAKNGASTVLEGSSRDGFEDADGLIKIVQDKAGRYFIAISPEVDYTSVEIKAFSESLLGVLANGYNLHIYGMCYETDFDGCEEGFSTSWDGSGLSVGVTGLGSYGVTDAFKALNNNNNSDYSTLSLGTLNVAGHIQQNIQYNKVVPANTIFRLKMEVGTGTVNAAVFDDIRILGYKNGVEVYNQPVQTAVLGGVSLGTLFNNGGAHDVSLVLDEDIDEIALRINSLVNATIGVPDVRLYYITQDCAEPKIILWKSYEIDGDNTKTSVRGGEEVEYTIHVRNIGGRDLAGFTVTDELPQGLTYVSGSGGIHNNGIVSFASTSVLPIGQEDSFTFKAKVVQDLTNIDEIKNIAVVKLPGVNDDFESYPPVDNTNPTEPDTTKNPGTIIPVEPVYDFTVAKNGVSNGVNSNQAELGDEITYTIAVKNTGNKNLTSVTVKDILQNAVPAEVSIVDDGGAIVNGAELTFNVSDLAVGATETFILTVEVESLPAGNISNKAQVSFTTPDNDVITKEVEFEMAASCTNIDASAIDAITTDPSSPVCPGTEVTLTTTLSASAPTGLINPVFKWYKNSNLSDTPLIGESIVVTIFATTTYYVTVEGTGFCFTGAAAEVEVEALPIGLPEHITITAPTEICQGEEATFKAELSATAPVINTPVFKWYTDAALTELVHEGEEFKVSATPDLVGTQTLYVSVEGDNFCANAVGNTAIHTIVVNPSPELTVSSNQIYTTVGTTVTWPTATTNNGAVITWYDAAQNDVTNNLPTSFATAGTYTYTIVAQSGDCYTVQTILTHVYDANDCPPVIERIYATVDKGWGSIITGGVSATGNTVDGNPKTHSTLTTGVGLLGIGTVWQNVEFDHEVPAGTPVTIKLGKEYSGLMLAGGISVQGLNSDGSTIGGLKTVAGGLLDLLAADNVMEFTFVPSDKSGPKAYWGVRISQGSLLSVAQNAKVYGVYYTKEGTVNCDPIDSNTKKDVLDVLHGVEDIGLGVASATASVVNPWDAVDNDLDTYALISRGVAVLNRATLTVVFKQQATPGDELQIITEIPGNPVLSLELIKGYKIQRYLGNEPVGPELDNTSSVLDLKLLGLGYSNKYKIIINPVNEPYDRVKISYGSVVGVLGDFTRIYDVSIAPKIDIPEADQPIEVCLGKDLIIPITDACTTYVVYTSETGTEVLTTTDGFNFEVPKSWAEGTYTLYVQAIRNGCEIGSRVPVQIEAVKCSKDCIISNPMITNKIKK